MDGCGGFFWVWMDGCWRGVGGREKGGGVGLVAGAATTATAGRNSKNYHSYVLLLSEYMISPI